MDYVVISNSITRNIKRVTARRLHSEEQEKTRPEQSYFMAEKSLEDVCNYFKKRRILKQDGNYDERVIVDHSWVTRFPVYHPKHHTTGVIAQHFGGKGYGYGKYPIQNHALLFPGIYGTYGIHEKEINSPGIGS